MLILCRCTELVQGLTVNVSESYLPEVLVKVGLSELCLDWSRTSPSLLFEKRQNSVTGPVLDFRTCHG